MWGASKAVPTMGLSQTSYRRCNAQSCSQKEAGVMRPCEKQKEQELHITFACDYMSLADSVKGIIFKHWHLFYEISGCEMELKTGKCVLLKI